tara:strand:- start:1820 stop:2473 length:654 start_codon:yes stop_codon:yes gene_type:complete
MTDHSNLGNFSVKAVESNEIQFYVGSGTTKATLKLDSSPGSDYDINLPTSSGTLALTTDVESLPTASSGGQIMVADSSFDFQAVDASGAVTISDTGSFSIADNAIESNHIDTGAVDSNQLAADCVNADKIADDAVQDEHIQNLGTTDGTAEASKIPKMNASNELTGASLLGATDIKADTSLNINDNWKFVINGSNLELQYSSDSGTTWNTKQVFQSS